MSRALAGNRLIGWFNTALFIMRYLFFPEIYTFIREPLSTSKLELNVLPSWQELFSLISFSFYWSFLLIYLSLPLLFHLLRLHVTRCVYNIEFNNFCIVYRKKTNSFCKEFFLQTMAFIRKNKGGVSHFSEIWISKTLKVH